MTRLGANEDLPVRFSARVRNSPDHSLGQIWEGDLNAVAALQALGWGAGLGVEGETTHERLAVVSNDYWLVDRLAAMVGLSDLATGVVDQIDLFGGVSFVIPARGVGDTIEEVVDSIATSAEAAGAPWECIIVDDASEPALPSLGSHDGLVRLIRSADRVYCGGARNIGLAESRYDAIIFCDGDTQVSPRYVREHAFRHLLAPNLVCVSMREQLPEGAPTPQREPDGTGDTRVLARYIPGRLGLIPVTQELEVRALDETNHFREFGLGRTLGPVDLAFMVKGNNLSTSRGFAEIRFPPDFVGYGPEDGAFAAKAIARGAFVIPVLAASVFHREHPPRSGGFAERDLELIPNLERQRAHLGDAVWDDWVAR